MAKRDVDPADLADEVGTALVEEGKRNESREELEQEAERLGLSPGTMSTEELRHAVAQARPAAGREPRGAQNEIEYYNPSEGGSQHDSGGQETPGPVSDPPSEGL